MSIEAPVVQYFNAGIQETDIRNMLQQAGIHAHPGLIQLYSWHNGMNDQGIPSGKILFMGLSVFVPLKESIRCYQEDVAGNYYPSSLFPVCPEDYILVDIKQEGNNDGKVFFYSPHLVIMSPVVICDSLYSMFDTILQCFQHKAYWYDNEGFF